MPAPLTQLLSRTVYATDGVTTTWDFSFSGGYLDKAHVKAYIELPTGERTDLTITDPLFTGPYQLFLSPALAAGSTLTIYRDTPKDLPLVDFADEGGLSEIALDTMAKQAIFVAAETTDTVNTSSSYDAEQAADQAATAAAAAVISANAAEASAVTADDHATSAGLSAVAAAASASLSAVTSINGGQLAGLRNRIINGDMRVAQRGALSITNGVSNYGGCDRTTLYPGSFSTAVGTVQQSAFPYSSAGFAQWLNVTTTGIGTIQAIQKIEAVNVKDLNSKTVTVSAILYQDTGAVLNAVISLYKTGTVDNWATPVLISTSSATSVPSASATAISKQFTLGASDATNGLFVQIQFQAVGAVTSKNFYIGDFQLEVGSVATPFEQRPYGLELMLCQRYYQRNMAAYAGSTTNAGQFGAAVSFPVAMRAAPTGAFVSAVYASNFPATAGVFNIAPTAAGYMYEKAASTTGAGRYLDVLSFSAEL